MGIHYHDRSVEGPEGFNRGAPYDEILAVDIVAGRRVGEAWLSPRSSIHTNNPAATPPDCWRC
jgi:hypothetical protein